MQPVLDRDAILRSPLGLPRSAGGAARAGVRHPAGDGHAAGAEGSARAGASKYIRYGSSPRGAQALVECGRVLALMRGRFHLSRRRHSARGARRAAPPHHSELRRPRRRADAGYHSDAIIKGVTAQASVA